MNRDQAGHLLGAIAVIDRRIVGAPEIAIWHQLLADVDYNDASAAVIRHFRDSHEYLMPAHIRAGAAEVGRERRRAERELEAQHAIEAYRADAGPLTDRSAEIQAFVGQVRGALPEGDREALAPRQVAWEREQRAYQRNEAAEPNLHFDPTLDAPPPWQVNAGTENGAWWEDDRARERHAQELLSAAGRLRPRTTRETS